MLKNSIAFIHKPVDEEAFLPNTFVPVEIKIRNTGGPLDLELTESYPPEITLYDPSTGQWAAEDPWIVTMHLDRNEEGGIFYYVLTPDKAGSYRLRTDIAYMENGVSEQYGDFALDIRVEEDAAALNNHLLSALGSLSAAANEGRVVDRIREYIGLVKKEGPVSGQEMEENIHIILKAVDYLDHIKSVEVSHIRLMLDKLMKVWQGRYYFGHEDWQ